MKLTESEIKQTILTLGKIKNEFKGKSKEIIDNETINFYTQQLFEIGFNYQEAKEHPNFFDVPYQIIQFNKHMIDFYELIEEISINNDIGITGHKLIKVTDHLINALGMLLIAVLLVDVSNTPN